MVAIRLADDSPTWAGNYDLFSRVERGETARDTLIQNLEEAIKARQDALKAVTAPSIAR